MSDKEITKLAFAEAEKEAREKQIVEVKKIVTKTLEKLAEVRKNIKTLQEDERILKMDIDDLKEGRLDRISERQEKDPEAKKISVVLIIKEKEVIREVSPWYFPYQVIWPTVPYVHEPIRYGSINCERQLVSCGDAYENNTIGLSNGATFNANITGGSITCSVAKDASVGAYNINGHIVHLR